MDLEELEFSFAAEDDHDAIRRAMEILAVLTGEWPEAQSIEPEGETVVAKKPPKGKPMPMKPGGKPASMPMKGGKMPMKPMKGCGK